MTKRKQHTPDFKAQVADGRLLLLSPFASSDRRVIKDLAMERNRFVAAFTDEVVFAHVTPLWPRG